MVKILLMAFAIGTVASAVVAEPVTLADVQMDRITAGANVTNEPGNFRYESDNAIVEMIGHEGLAEYEVTETKNGVAIVANVVSTGSKAAARTGDQTINIGTGGVCVACANTAAAMAANVASAGSEATATTGHQTIRGTGR